MYLEYIGSFNYQNIRNQMWST